MPVMTFDSFGWFGHWAYKIRFAMLSIIYHIPILCGLVMLSQLQSQEPQGAGDRIEANSRPDDKNSDPSPVSANQLQATKRTDGKDSERANQQKRQTEPSLLNPSESFLMVAFSGLLAGVGTFQVWLLFQQHRHMRIQQRAWCAYMEVTLFSFVTGEKVGTKAAIKNTGATPAFIDRQYGEIVVRRSDDAEALAKDFLAVRKKFDTQEAGYAVVMPPGTDGHVFTNIHKERTVDDDLQSLMSKPKGESMFFIGIVSYIDVFDKRHITTCCYRFQPSLLSDLGKFVGYRWHNHMT